MMHVCHCTKAAILGDEIVFVFQVSVLRPSTLQTSYNLLLSQKNHHINNATIVCFNILGCLYNYR
jgi:hypothetical protein